MWKSIKAGYNASFTKANIKSGFRQSGLWPFHATLICKNGMRASINDCSIVIPEALNNEILRYLTDFKRHGPPPPLVRYGYICTQMGIELIRVDLRTEIRLLELDRAHKRQKKEAMEARKASERFESHKKKKRHRESIEVSKTMDRVNRHGIPFHIPRSLVKRRNVARENALRRRYNLAQARID